MKLNPSLGTGPVKYFQDQAFWCDSLSGDVTYRRHGWKIECEKCGEFADTVFGDSRFEIRGSIRGNKVAGSKSWYHIA